MPQLTGIQMKYLHAIYRVETVKKEVRSIDVAKELGVSKASVHKMLELFASLGFIKDKPFKYILLTSEGKKYASLKGEKFSEAHMFFSEYLDLEQQQALECTYSLLCHFPDTCINRLLDIVK